MTDETEMESAPPDESNLFDPINYEDLDTSSTVIDPEVVEPAPTAERRRGTCEICGNKAWDGRSRRCEEHKSLPKLTSKPLSSPRGRKGSTPLTQAVTFDAKQIKDAILKANPQIVMAGQYISGVPDEWLDRGPNNPIAQAVVGQNPDGSPKVVTFFDPCLRTQFEFTEKQAELVANSLVEFSNTQTGKRLLTVSKAMSPWATLAAGGGVILMHVVKLSNIKSQVLQLKTMLEQSRNQVAGPQQASVPDPSESYGAYTESEDFGLAG